MKPVPLFNKEEFVKESIDFIIRSYRELGREINVDFVYANCNVWLEQLVNSKIISWPYTWKRQQINKGSVLYENWLDTLTPDDRELVEDFIDNLFPDRGNY